MGGFSFNTSVFDAAGNQISLSTDNVVSTDSNDGLSLQDFMPAGAGDTVAHAGKPLDPGTPVADKETVIEAMKTVHDPEIPVNIYDLGLIYALDIADACHALVLNQP